MLAWFHGMLVNRGRISFHDFHIPGRAILSFTSNSRFTQIVMKVSGERTPTALPRGKTSDVTISSEFKVHSFPSHCDGSVGEAHSQSTSER